MGTILLLVVIGGFLLNEQNISEEDTEVLDQTAREIDEEKLEEIEEEKELTIVTLSIHPVGGGAVQWFESSDGELTEEIDIEQVTFDISPNSHVSFNEQEPEGEDLRNQLIDAIQTYHR